MPQSETSRRPELTEAIAAIVLEDGLDALGLRGLAARLSTSGRMLLYHFGTKDALVRAVMTRISDQMALLQDAAASRGLRTAGELLGDMMQAGIDPVTAPFMRVWTDVMVRAAHGESPYRDIAGQAATFWLDWLKSRLHPSPDRDAHAAAVLSIMEGITILEMACPGMTNSARTILRTALDRI